MFWCPTRWERAMPKVFQRLHVAVSVVACVVATISLTDMIVLAVCTDTVVTTTTQCVMPKTCAAGDWPGVNCTSRKVWQPYSGQFGCMSMPDSDKDCTVDQAGAAPCYKAIACL